MQHRLRTVLPVLLVAAVGLGICLTIEYVHQQLTNDASYVSFCSVNTRVDCDVVLSSAYAKAFGVTISLWGTLYYAGILLLAGALASVDRQTQRRTLAAALFAASILGLLFSIYMAYVAFVILNTICLLCSALYLVSLALFALSWRLRGTLEHRGTRRSVGKANNDRWVWIASSVAGVVLIAVALWEAVLAPSPALSAESIKSERPEFYQWFQERPIVSVATDVGNSFGAIDAAVTIVEFSDFACGHCAAFDHTLAQVLRGAQARVIYRHFPLDSECNPSMETSGRQTCLAATAAECAAEQGQFWRYHQLLFENQPHFKRSELIDYAREVGIDLAKFENCLQSDEARKRVARDVAEGLQLKIQSTPTLFINGRKIEGALDPQRLTDALTLAGAAS